MARYQSILDRTNVAIARDDEDWISYLLQNSSAAGLLRGENEKVLAREVIALCLLGSPTELVAYEPPTSGHWAEILDLLNEALGAFLGAESDGKVHLFHCPQYIAITKSKYTICETLETDRKIEWRVEYVA